jgi:hypothetical protein
MSTDLWLFFGIGWVLLLIPAYLFSSIISMAYFQEKLEYHRKALREIEGGRKHGENS